MKKGRPALQVSALAPPDAAAAVERAFFRNSTTLGLRRRRLERVVLARSFVKVATTLRRPCARSWRALDGEVLGAHPEFEDCRRLAARARRSRARGGGRGRGRGARLADRARGARA